MENSPEGQGVEKNGAGPSNGSTLGSTYAGLSPYSNSLFSDIDLMLNFARESGRRLPADLPRRVAGLQGERSLESLIQVHNDLCEVIRPATPATLVATQPSERAGSRVPSVPMFNMMLRLSIVALILHLVTTAWLRTEAAQHTVVASAGVASEGEDGR